MITGSVRAKEKDGIVYIGKLMVHPDYRRKGYGSRMLSKIEAYFPKNLLHHCGLDWDLRIPRRVWF